MCVRIFFRLDGDGDSRNGQRAVKPNRHRKPAGSNFSSFPNGFCFIVFFALVLWVGRTQMAIHIL